MPSAYGPMVKRKSSLASNKVFRVRVLVGLLKDNNETEGQPDWRREPVGSRLSDKPCGFDSRSFRWKMKNMLAVA